MKLCDATVLVVDDEPVLRLTMCLLLERAGATVFRAADGAEALAVVLARQVDAMVCDQNMPVMDGEELLRMLEERGTVVPTLFFAGEGVDVDLLERMGVRRVIAKPIQPAALVEAVRGVLAEVANR